MVLRKLSQSFKVSLAIVLSVMTSGVPTSMAYATQPDELGKETVVQNDSTGAVNAAVAREVCPNSTFTPETGGWEKTDGLSATTFNVPQKTGFTVTQICYKASTTVNYPAVSSTVTSTVTNSNNQVQNLSHVSVYYTKNAVTADPCAANFFPEYQMWEITWGRQFSDTSSEPTFTPQSNGGLVTINGVETTWNDYHLYVTVTQVNTGRTVTYGFADGTIRTAVVSADVNNCPSVVWTETSPPTVTACETQLGAIHSTNVAPNGWTFPSDAEYVNGGAKLNVSGTNPDTTWDETYISRAMVGPLADIGSKVDFEASPEQYVGLHIVTDNGILVYEKEGTYAGKWWSTSDFGVASGMGYATFDTLANIVAANPEVMTSELRVLYTHPSASNSVITSVTVGCTVFTFDKEEIEDRNQGLCHATSNGGYVLIKNIDSAGIYNGHYGASHHDARDIIPTFTYNGQTYSQNWDTAEQKAIYDADCKVATVCTVSNNTYLAPWTFGGDTYPEAGDGGSYDFKADGLHLSTPTIDAYVYGLTSAGNTPLNDVDAMSYKTLRKAESAGFGSTTPAYILQIDTNGIATAGGTKYYFYEPYYNSPPAVQEGIWQTWDTLDGGDAQWWTGPSQTLSTWSSIVAAYPDGVVIAYGFNQGSYNAEIYSAVQDITFDDCATTHFGAPGQGGGEVLGDQTGGGQGGGKILGTVLPAMIPSTGGNDSPFMIIIASLLAYGAAYFLQGRRMLGRNESLRV